jgi:nucleoside-diphosphate-sugar epimerase
MILITGATGFLGRNIVPLLSRRAKLRILVRPTSHIDDYLNNPDIEIAFGDIETGAGIDHALKDIDLVIHAAARTKGRNYPEYYRSNVCGTHNLVCSMNRTKTKKIIFLSSQAACGPSSAEIPLTEQDCSRPVSLYGRTKLLAEEVVRNSCLDYIILRPASVFGPHDTDVLRFIWFIKKGIVPMIGLKDKYLNLIYVEDLAQIISRIIDKDAFNKKTYFVHDGNKYRLSAILAMIARMLHKNTHVIYIPGPVAMCCGLFNDIFLPISKRMVGRDKIRELTQNYWLCDNSRITAEYAFQSYATLEKAMQQTMNWYKNNGFLG